jgi:hypothetical protein
MQHTYKREREREIRNASEFELLDDCKGVVQVEHHSSRSDAEVRLQHAVSRLKRRRQKKKREWYKNMRKRVNVKRTVSLERDCTARKPVFGGAMGPETLSGNPVSK